MSDRQLGPLNCPSALCPRPRSPFFAFLHLPLPHILVICFHNGIDVHLKSILASQVALAPILPFFFVLLFHLPSFAQCFTKEGVHLKLIDLPCPSPSPSLLLSKGSFVFYCSSSLLAFLPYPYRLLCRPFPLSSFVSFLYSNSLISSVSHSRLRGCCVILSLSLYSTNKLIITLKLSK